MLRSLVRLNSKHQAGISLLEVMLSLSIIAIILVMATRYFFMTSDNSNINKVRGQIGTVISGLQEYRNQNPNYSSATIGTLIADGFVVKTNDVSGSSASDYALNNPWNNPITVTAVNSGNGAEISTDLPSATACNALLTGYASSNGTCAGADNKTFTVSIGTGS